MYVIVNAKDSSYFYMLNNSVVYTKPSILKTTIFDNLDLANKQCEICNELSENTFVVKQVVLQDV